VESSHRSELDSSIEDSVGTVKQMAEGHTHAQKLLLRMLGEGRGRGWACIYFLDDMNIRGSQIWICFRDVAEKDLGVFMDLIEHGDRRQPLVDCCNHPNILRSTRQVAVLMGAMINGRQTVGDALEDTPQALGTELEAETTGGGTPPLSSLR